jgi:hypothetical protein
MSTPKAFHGCFGRLTRDASDSNDWITVKRSKKNRKKVGVLQELSDSNRVLKVTFSNSNKAMQNQEVAPKVSQSLPNGTSCSTNVKPSMNFKKNVPFTKKPKNSLDKSFTAFSEDLNKLVKSQEFVQLSLAKADQQMLQVKKELSESANLLLIHKCLTRQLHQLRSERNPVISKTKNMVKMQKKYENYINSVDALRETVGKLKVQSITVRENIGKWKREQRISTDLLQDYLQEDDLSLNEDDCFQASSSAPPDIFYENNDNYCEHWNTILRPPSPDCKCRFVHQERKPPAKPHSPACPVHNFHRSFERREAYGKREHTFETPPVNENSSLAPKVNTLQNAIQNHKNRFQFLEEKILLLRQRIKSLIRNKVQYDTIADVETELSSLITEGAWTEKEIIRLNAKISELRKQQGFTRIARAFMATMINPEDPFQVTASLIHRNPSYDMLQFPQVCNTPIHGFDDLLLLDNPENTELQEDDRKLRTATAQLKEELDKVKAELTQIYHNLNNAEVSSNPKGRLLPTNAQPVDKVHDLLSAPSNTPHLLDTENKSKDISLQAKLAKELIKLASSYKIPELTFDVQASNRRFNFSTWFAKLQTILSMFPQTASVIEDSGTIRFYENSNDLGNKALFLLIGSKVDTYFQWAIRHFAGQGDEALAFIKSQCANISNEDRTHFHHAFTTLCIKENESATAFIRRFIYAKTEAETAGNSYTEYELVSFVLTGLHFSKNPKYDTALQLYRLEREHGKMLFSL